MKNALLFLLLAASATICRSQSLHADLFDYDQTSPSAFTFAAQRITADTIKPITKWDTDGYSVTTYDTRLSDPEGADVIIFRKAGRDTLLTYDPAVGAWVPSKQILVPRSGNRFLRQPMFETRPKGRRKTTADALAITSVVLCFVNGYHAGASEWSLSQSGWPRSASAYHLRDASIWGDCASGALLGISTGLNFNQELHWKTGVRFLAFSAACFLSRYGGTRVGYFKDHPQ